MRPRLFPSLALLLALALSSPARAEFPRLGVYIGPLVGGNLVLRKWDFGPQGESYYLAPSHGAVAGARLGVQITSRLIAEMDVAYLPVPAGGQTNSALAFDLNIAFHILKGNWTPILEAGFGGYWGTDKLAGDLDPRIHFGAGVRGLLKPWLALRLDVRDVLTDGFDKTNLGGNNLEILLGLDIFVWRAKELSDRDHDEVVDKEDRCPDDAGLKDLRGCPDRDLDGIADPDDQCPDEPGDAAHHGCPERDSDSDGIVDEKDKCPEVPAGKHPDPARRGCPADRDGDGVIDDKDACPSVKGEAASDPAKNGCPPDRDGDTVPDATDACPDQPGAPSPDPKRNGCPGLVTIKKDSIVILDKIYFDLDSARLSRKSDAVLDAVVNAIRSLPEESRVSVEGHTDESGSADYNKGLSERRAASVVEYLVKKGVKAARLEAHGFGTEHPIADNGTEAGREQNRRVEFRILTQDPPSE